jgi:N-acetylglucosamine-6-sulfatase
MRHYSKLGRIALLILLSLLATTGLTGLTSMAAAIPDTRGIAQPHARAQAHAVAQRPNIVVFYTDDMRADELKFMPKTCRLLRQNGMSFGRYYSNNPLCCPFRAIALSGQYSHNNNVFGNAKRYHGGIYYFDPHKSIAPYMQDAGYLTGYIGKYLNGYRMAVNGTPSDWDEWFVPTHKIYAYKGTVVNDNGVKRTYPQYITGVYERETNATIKKFAASGKPWMLYVSHLAPHGSGPKPPIPAKKYQGTVKVSDLPKAILEGSVGDKPSWIRGLRHIDHDMPGIKRSWVRRAESLKSVDDAVASMIRTLKQTGQLDNTVIMFTSDNGYMRGEHNIAHGKIVPYEPSAQVPFFVRGPGFPRGVVSNNVVGAVDIAPTILSLAGVEVPYPVDGQSLLKPLAHRKMLLEAGPMLMHGVNTKGGVLRFYTAVVDKRYKFVRYWDGEVELYRMNGNRSENNNLANDSAYRSVLHRYRHWLQQLKNCEGRACVVH